MKIGIDCRMFSSRFTGIGRYTYELVHRMLELNHKLKDPHQIVLFFNQPEYQKFRTTFPVKKVLVNARHYSWREQTVFLRKLNQEKCDMVHFPHFNVPFLYRRPFTVTIHDLTLSMFPGKKLNKWYHRLAYQMIIRRAVSKARKVVSVSENTKKDIIKHLKIKEDKIEVIYNGVNPEFDILENPQKTEKTLKKYGIKLPFLLYTGVWRNHKNVPSLIRALKYLQERGLDFQLVITGKDDPHYPEVKATIKELGLEEQVILPGLVSEKELVHLYNAAHMFVFPSFYEGFGLPPLEAMSCGTPVICSNSSCLPEICGKENALFFDPNNVEELVEQVEKLHADVALQIRLIDNGKRRSAEFCWEKMAKDTFKIIHGI